MVDYLAVVDTETSGLEPGIDRVIEVAVAIYHIPTKSVVHSLSALTPIGKPIGSKITSITGISEDMLEAADKGAYCPWQAIQDMVDAYSAKPTAHNASLDKRMILQDISIPDMQKQWVDTDWLDTMSIEFPIRLTSKKLSHIAVDLKVPTGKLHRALADVLLLCDVLAAIPDLGEQLNSTATATVTIQAMVSFHNKDKAKAVGFGWVDKKWVKVVRVDPAQLQSQLVTWGQSWGFAVQALDAPKTTAAPVPPVQPLPFKSKPEDDDVLF